MNRSLRAASLLVTSFSAAIPLAGCSVSVDENSIILESLVRYEGTEQSAKVDYTSGQAIHVISSNGDVDVVPGVGTQVEVTFSPFTMDKKEEGARAVAQIEDNLKLSAVTMGDVIIKVARDDGSSGYLGADIRVALPKGFEGAFEVEQHIGSVDIDFGATLVQTVRVGCDNGSIDVLNARGRLDMVTDLGDVTVDVDQWSLDNGSLRTRNGDIRFTVPANINGTMTASASMSLTEQGIPSDTWAVAGEDTQKSYTMGDGQGARVDLLTEFGDIELVVK